MMKYTSEPKRRISMAFSHRKSMANKKRSQKAGKSLNRYPLFYQITSLLLIILGAAILIAVTFNRFSQQFSPASAPKQESAYEIQPAKLYIPKLAKPLIISN